MVVASCMRTRRVRLRRSRLETRRTGSESRSGFASRPPHGSNRWTHGATGLFAAPRSAVAPSPVAVWRPARPAIWAHLRGLRARGPRPSNLPSP